VHDLAVADPQDPMKETDGMPGAAAAGPARGYGAIPMAVLVYLTLIGLSAVLVAVRIGVTPLSAANSKEAT
jgi:hypothetical protein